MAALSLFFKAEQIFVTGTSRYSQQQVLQASGIRQGGNLFLLNKHQAAASITEQLPYVESVRIRRQLPNALHIEITECAHPLALEQDGAVWLLNGSGKLIDKLQPGQGESYPLVTGLALTSPQLNWLAVPDNTDKWDTLRQLWQQLLSKDMAGSVQSIDLEDPSRITLRYLDRFDVVLKKDDDFDYRNITFVVCATMRRWPCGAAIMRFTRVCAIGGGRRNIRPKSISRCRRDMIYFSVSFCHRR